MGTDNALIKGALDLLILKVVSLEPMHGWGLTQRIQSLSGDALAVQQLSVAGATAKSVHAGRGVGRLRHAPAAAALGSTLSRRIYGIGPADAASLAAGAAALLGAWLLAAVVPAARAGRTDPVQALRAD